MSLGNTDSQKQRKLFKLYAMNINKLELIASGCKLIKGKNQTEKRMRKFEYFCKIEGIEFIYVGYKPNAHACEIKEMKTCYRFFPRCGYGKWNYAPCYEIKKD